MTKKVIKGVLKTWKEDRGFGFITPDNGGRDIFIHISALKGVSRRPEMGDIIYYQVTKDSRGKLKAINAQIEGVSRVDEKTGSSAQGNAIPDKAMTWLIAVAVLVAAAVGAYFLLNRGAPV